MGGCIWYGNDDGELMNNMTGGSLPAHTWHDVMAYAHQGVQLKPIVGMTPSAPAQTAANDAGANKAADPATPQRPASLSKGAAEALSAIAAKAKNLPLGKGAAIEGPASIRPARAAAQNLPSGSGALE
jgi:penicillin-binding protein 1A